MPRTIIAYVRRVTAYIRDMTITAKFSSLCGCGCGRFISVGDQVDWSRGQKARLAGCAGKPSAPARTLSQRPRYRMGSGHGSAVAVRGYSSYCTDRPGCRCYDCAS
jgi:hypothetical protein